MTSNGWTPRLLCQGRTDAAPLLLIPGALTGELQEREPLYYDALEDCPVATLILTGTEPLWPTRRSERLPCLLDAQDLWQLGQLARTHRARWRIEQIPGADHIALRREPQAILARIAQWQTQQGERPTTTP